VTFALLLLGCQTPADTVDDAEEALRTGDYERATILYQAAAASRPLDPLTNEKAVLALRRAVDGRLERALEAEARGDFKGALAELGASEQFAPGDPRVKEERARIARRETFVRAEIERARAYMKQGQAVKADEILSGIGEAGRVVADFDTLCRQAREAAGSERTMTLAREKQTRNDAVIAAADEAYARGAHGAALVLIERAGDDPELVRRSKHLIDPIRDRLLAMTEEERAAGHPASALLICRAAMAADPRSERARQAAEVIAGGASGALNRRVLVNEFEDRTGGRVDPLRLHRELTAALTHAFTEFTAEGEDVDLVVSGTITDLTVTTSAPKSENRVHEYVVRTEQELNPAHDGAKRALATASQRLSDRENIYAGVRRELYELERLEGSPSIRQNGNRHFGTYSEAAFYRALTDARAREVRARESLDRANNEVETAGRRLSQTPYYLDRKIVGRVPYSVRTVTKTATAEATCTLSPASPDAVSTTVTGTDRALATVTDSSHEGLPTADLAPDPLQLPSDTEIAEEVLTDLVARLARRIEAGVDRSRVALLTDARNRERSGDTRGALEIYSSFLLTTGGDLTLERATAARKIREAFGIEVGPNGIELSGMRLSGLE
jgi:hypothetical protein